MDVMGEATLPPPKKVRWARWKPSSNDELLLSMAYCDTPKPSAMRRDALAMAMGVDERRVRVWFQNQRQRHACTAHRMVNSIVTYTPVDAWPHALSELNLVLSTYPRNVLLDEEEVSSISCMINVHPAAIRWCNIVRNEDKAMNGTYELALFTVLCRAMEAQE